MEQPILNKVAQSGIITINLESYYPNFRVVGFDMSAYLWHGMVLKEKEFRAQLLTVDWEAYQGAVVHVYCATDALIPTWAYMLVATYLNKVTKYVFYGNEEEALNQWFTLEIQKIQLADFADKRVVIKGCSDKKVPLSAYVALAHALTPIVKSLMFGEPCSTVPLFKRNATTVE